MRIKLHSQNIGSGTNTEKGLPHTLPTTRDTTLKVVWGGSNGSRNRRNTPSRLGGCQVTEAAGVCVTRALCHSDDDALPDTTMRPRSHGTHVCVRLQVSCMLHLSCHQTGALGPTWKCESLLRRRLVTEKKLNSYLFLPNKVTRTNARR